MDTTEIREKIRTGKTYLGIELGSTRIKASLIANDLTPVASGSHSWENRFENGFWTYSEEDISNGLKSCFSSLAKDVKDRYSVTLATTGAMGVSAMMHGYMPFDENDSLLVPFRTWRNTVTAEASAELTELFNFNIPQRWSIAHLYQAVLNGEAHIGRLKYINTLAGYVHFLLTGRREVGIGEASGIFPVDRSGYRRDLLEKAEERFLLKGFDRPLAEVLPAVRMAGEKGAFLTEAGAKYLDPSGNFKAGVPVCPPEGDAGTGMVATNSVLPETGNISAGTSVFAMLVLKDLIKGCYPEIDMVATPDGSPAAMVHCNNCCGELDAWVGLFREFAELSGMDADISEIYRLLYTNAMASPADADGIIAYNFIAGEPVAQLESGVPMYFRNGGRPMTLGGFFRAQLYASAACLKLGMDILFEKEHTPAESFTCHGGLFKVKGAAQQIMADTLGADMAVMETAGEGGAWGMALLAAYMEAGQGMSLAGFLKEKAFAGMSPDVLSPDPEGIKGAAEFMKNYKAGLSAQEAAAREVNFNA